MGPVFGDESWEKHRILTDRVSILQNANPQGANAQSADARKAYAMAERVETHAKILREKLQEGRVLDDAMPLAWFAPRCRLRLLFSY